ncbi:MAG: hypothetical protein KME46_22120 [Brasilonema angustatum HA4187-MV1]|jgi:hypothetical protein|nr:hypothetical protein [Brasilonema angustatum HA4187-MV1]
MFERHIPTNNPKLAKLHKTGILVVTLPLVPSSFTVCLHAYTSPDAQSSKVGKTETSESVVKRRKSPNQRKYEDVPEREYLLPDEVDALDESH